MKNETSSNEMGSMKSGYMHEGLRHDGDRVPMGVELPKAGMGFTRGKGQVGRDAPTLGPRTA